MKLRSALAALGFAFICGLALCVPAQGLTPVPPSSAGIVFSNGGRIFSTGATGSPRASLVAGELPGYNTRFGFTDPQVSPDGTRLVFVLKPADRSTGPDVWVANADGSDPQAILDGNASDYYSTPSWMPDSETLLVGHTRVQGDSYEAGLITVKDDGTGATDALRIDPRTATKDEPGATITRPVVSPDGKFVLFVLADWITDEDTGTRAGRLETIELATGKRRLIAAKSFGGSWSPDGKKIVYSRPLQDVEKVCTIYECIKGARLFITTLDGRYESRVIAPERGVYEDYGDERNPDWSDDGSRILFQSENNLPSRADAYEVYSVKPDGGCLTWLTNGTPASTAPSWAMSATDSTEPASCGDNGLAPKVEVAPPDNQTEGFVKARYWLGGNLNGRLYTGRYDSQPDFGTVSSFFYYDCANFDPKECGSAIRKYEYSMCSYRGELARLFFNYSGKTFGRTRGVPSIYGLSNGYFEAFLITGDRLVGANRVTGVFDKTLRGPEIFNAITPVGTDASTKKNLKPPLFPAPDIRHMRRVVRVAAHTTTVEVAAKILHMKPNLVKANLRMSRQLPAFGPIRTLKCPKVRE